MVSVCLPSDCCLQCLLSYLGFSYLGRGVSLHGCSSKAQPLPLTLDVGYLLSAAHQSSAAQLLLAAPKPILLYLLIYFYLEANYFTILYWFCLTSTWFRHRCIRVPNPEPLSHLPPRTIPLGHPSAPALSFLYPASSLDWRFISYMILYMFQCHSPKSSPTPSPTESKRLFYTSVSLWLSRIQGYRSNSSKECLHVQCLGSSPRTILSSRIMTPQILNVTEFLGCCQK